MFALICAGRPVQTDFQQVDAQKFLFQIHEANQINHLVVFLTGSLPVGYGASVHFLWPSPNPSWNFLGVLTNEKPSAIFKLGGTKVYKSTDELMEDDAPFIATVETIAQLGISIEPIELINQMQSQALAIPKRLPSLKDLDIPQLLGKMLENFYNYISSFTTSLPPGGFSLFHFVNSQDFTNAFIPAKAFQEWYKQITHKLEQDPFIFIGKDRETDTGKEREMDI